MPAAKPAARRPAAARPATGGAFGSGGWRRRRKVPPKALAQFTSQLATVVNAGVPLVRCLRILEGQTKPGPLKDVLEAVSDDVEGGAPLSEALAKYPQVFDRLYINMVRAGEAGGVLGTILQRLADFSLKSEAIKSKVRQALVYPFLVLGFAGFVLAFVMLFVVPKFEDIFESFDTEMPLPTAILIQISRVLGTYWYVWLAVPVLAFALWKILLRSEGFAWRMDNMKLVFPLTGGLIRKSMIARFSRTMGTLLQSGVPILEALAIVSASVQNRVLEDALADLHDAIREGENLAETLHESGVFDDLVVNMIDVGEETGQLDTMLLRIADTFEDEVDNEVNTVLKTLEPTIIFTMAIVVGTIVVSLFLPVVRIMETFQGA